MVNWVSLASPILTTLQSPDLQITAGSQVLPAFVNSLNTAMPICVCAVMVGFHAVMVELNSYYSDHTA